MTVRPRDHSPFQFRFAQARLIDLPIAKPSFRPPICSWFCGLLLALLALAPAQVFAQSRTYLALGDSFGFGYETGALTEAGNGDRGYVRPYADWLRTRPGFNLTRPTVANLSIPGETVGSFFNTSQIGALYNNNYPIFGRTSQSALLGTRVSSELAAGRTISHVSLSLGGNDLLALRDDATFTSAPLATQQARVTTAMNTMATGLTPVLQRIRTLLPTSELLIVGYFNMFRAVPSSPFFSVSEFALTELNTRLSTSASLFNARFVDLTGPFNGNEGNWSFITANPSGSNVHPNPTGYAQIAQAMIPAPGAGVILIAVIALRSHRRRAAA